MKQTGLYKLCLINGIIITIMTVSCRKNDAIKSIVTQGDQPSVGFSYTSDPGNVLNIKFENTSNNATSYYWQFGDGTTSTDTTPTHTYATSGRYMVKLISRSAAGYSADTTQQVIAASAATAGFSTMASGVWVNFNNTSASIDSCSWDFGDHTTHSNDISPNHIYASAGNYEVALTIYGIAGDTSVVKNTVNVNYNCINGGGFETSDAQYWSIWNVQNDNPPRFGFTGDKPSLGSGGCLQFPAFTAPSSGSTNELIYQKVFVQAGKKYQLSAHVKLPYGGSQCYMQFYLSSDADTWNENNGTPPTQLFMSLNTWHGWGGFSGSGPSVAVDGEITQIVHSNGDYGPFAATNGVYTATTTGLMYIGIQAGSYAGHSNGDYLIDDVSFSQVP